MKHYSALKRIVLKTSKDIEEIYMHILSELCQPEDYIAFYKDKTMDAV
jgi:uncharacterized membrane protein